jgi:hypothetical protein
VNRALSRDAALPPPSAAVPDASPSVESGWRAAWTPGRARLWLAAAAVAAWLPLLGVPLRGWLDFSAFYAAGRLAFTPEVTGLAAITAFQVEQGLPITPFVYPAGMALPYALLSALPYGLAAAVHAALMLALLLAAAVLGARLTGLPRRWALLGTLAWGPAAAGVASGQNTSLALLLVVSVVVALVAQRPVVAGVLTGLLGYKPQLAAPIVGTLVLRGRWLAIAVAAAMVAAHWGLGVLATGGALDWPLDWLHTVRSYQEADLAANGWQAISLPGLAARAGLALDAPWLVVIGYLAGAVIVLAFLPALRRLPTVEAFALAAALGLVVSPHAWVYDATLLLPALGVVAARAWARGWPWRERWWLAGAFAIALTWPIGGLVGVTLMPLLVLAAPFALTERGPFRPRPLDGPAQAPVASAGSD